jgi:hypothetical protein
MPAGRRIGHTSLYSHVRADGERPRVPTIPLAKNAYMKSLRNRGAGPIRRDMRQGRLRAESPLTTIAASIYLRSR